jgi:hypothetical protein
MLTYHIGFHKTGTSAIQEWMSEHRAWLEDRGVIYPVPLSELASHGELAWGLQEQPPPWANRGYDREEVLSYYRRIVASTPASMQVVVSSEELCNLNYQEGAVEILAETLGGDARVIAYVREHAAFVASIYHHYVRTGGVDDFATWHPQQNFKMADFASRLEPWARVFGRDAVTVRSYEEATAAGDIITDFLGTFDISYGDGTASPIINVGLHPWLVEAMLGANRELDAGDIADVRLHLVRASQRLPRVDAVRYYLGDEAEDFLSSFDPYRQRLADDFGIEITPGPESQSANPGVER